MVAKNSNPVRLLMVAIVLFVIAAVTIPVTLSITGPMIREIAMSGPGEPDLSQTRTIGKVGLWIAVASYLSALGFATASIMKLPRASRPRTCILTALLAAGIPYGLVMQGGPYNSAGDGGPNFFPLLVIAVGAIGALPYLIWFVVSLFILKSKAP